ncbi:MAG: thiamine phosphate synthase [Pseudomonadota bacterium]
MLLPSESTALNDNVPVVWSVSGSDVSGAAGVQTDLVGLSDVSVHGCTVITAVTAQHAQQVLSINPVSEKTLRDQFDALSADALPRVIKLGLLPTVECIEVVCEVLEQHPDVCVVCDPVIESSSGALLLRSEAIQLFVTRLLPHVDVLTPNAPELLRLASEVVLNSEECDVDNVSSQYDCVAALLNVGVGTVMLKGGHVVDGQTLNDSSTTVDRIWSLNGDRLCTAPKQFALVNRRHAHGARGTGCRLASVLAGLLAHDYVLEDACVLANAYLNRTISQAYEIDHKARCLPSVNAIELSDLPSVVCDVTDANALVTASKFAFVGSDSLGLYPVVDDVVWIERLIPLGVTTIQLRLKEMPMADVERQIIQAVALQKQYDIKLFINDYWELAIKHQAHGVHLGQEDLFEVDVSAIRDAGLALGLSTHSWWEVARAHTHRPSYLAFGPIYPTQTKTMPWEQQGLERLTQWVDCVGADYECVAIGGINTARMPEVLATGVDSVAMVSSITHVPDWAASTRELLSYFSDA